MKFSREFLTGILVVVAIAVLYLGVSYLKGINVFSKQQRFFAVYDNVAGLVSSNPVVLNGYKIGIVKGVQLSNKGDGRIVVEVVIDDANLKVPEDTKLEIYDADLFGSKAIQIVLGQSTVLAPNKDTLVSGVQLGLTESLKQEIEPLKKKSTELFASLDSIMGSLNNALKSAEGKQDIGTIFSSLKSTLSNLEATTFKVNGILDANAGNLQSMLTNVNSIATNLKDNNARITNAVTNFNAISDTLAKVQLAQTMKKVDNALAGFTTMLEKINSGQGSLGQMIQTDSLHRELVSASHSLDLLLNDMQTNPKRYVHFSVFGKKDTGEMSKRELEQLKEEIDRALQEKATEQKN
jgi:phospholipid/cholesterol/gamma-HCH transport system substrate-binding protein